LRTVVDESRAGSLVLPGVHGVRRRRPAADDRTAASVVPRYEYAPRRFSYALLITLAVASSVVEEVGLRVVPGAKVWESETHDKGFRLHWWTAEAEDGDVVMDPGEVSDVRWVTAEEFAGLHPVFEEDLVFFDRVLPEL
jgi:8-oxo-dGTP diphosphatase